MHRESFLGFVVAFRVCGGMRTEISDGAGDFGEEFFRELRDRVGTTLIWKLLNHSAK